MTTTREPDLEAEQEVDLGRYARAVVTRWWLPLAYAAALDVNFLVLPG